MKTNETTYSSTSNYLSRREDSLQEEAWNREESLADRENALWKQARVVGDVEGNKYISLGNKWIPLQ